MAMSGMVRAGMRTGGRVPTLAFLAAPEGHRLCAWGMGFPHHVSEHVVCALRRSADVRKHVQTAVMFGFECDVDRPLASLGDCHMSDHVAKFTCDNTGASEKSRATCR